MAKPETIFRAKVVKFLRTLPFCKILSIQQKSITGHPDIILCLVGRFVGIEIKTDINNPSERQILTLEEVLKAKGAAFILRPKNFEDIKEILVKLSRGIKYDSDKIQGLITPKTNASSFSGGKHTHVRKRRLRSKQATIGSSENSVRDSQSEQDVIEDFCEV